MAGADLYFRVRIKDREEFKKVFPLPIDNKETPAIAGFILSIIGKSIRVRRISNSPDSFCYLPVDDDRFIIMPNWIEYFETDGMIPVSNRFGIIERRGDGLVLDDIFVIAD